MTFDGRLVSNVGVLALTDEGRQLYAEIGPLLNGSEDVVTRTAGAASAVRGRLRVNVDPYWPGETFPLFALYPSRHLPAAKVRAIVDFVQEVVSSRANS